MGIWGEELKDVNLKYTLKFSPLKHWITLLRSLVLNLSSAFIAPTILHLSTPEFQFTRFFKYAKM